MFDNLKFIVVEDVERDRVEVLNQLAYAGFKPEHLLAKPDTYESAMQAIQEHAAEVDVVFLDLNLPRDPRDARPSRGIGQEILRNIHNVLNPKAGIRVVVVSGEDLLDGFATTMQDAWPGTLVSIARKSALAATLRASLKRLSRDPLAQALRRLKLDDVLAHYEVVVDGSQPIGERVTRAKAIGVALAGNEVDHHQGRVGYSQRYGERLHDMVRGEIESRFSAGPSGRAHIDMGSITSNGEWGAFLWRGAMVQHLYSLNQYRNTYIHLSEQPYQHARRDTWQIPRDLLESVSEGRHVGVVIESIVRDLIEWYLPWHEQVYLPWREGKS